MRFRIFTSAAALTLGLAFVPALSAQNPAGGQGRGGGMASRALQGITLTAAQQAQVDTITAAARAMMPARTQGVPMSDADRAAAMNIMQGSLKDIRAVLTPEQQKTFDQNVAAMQQQMQQRMQGGGPPPQSPPPAPAPATGK